MGDMTTQQKALAMVSLVGHFGFAIKLREDDGSWYVAIDADIREKGCLVGITTAEPTPFAAVDKTWKLLTELQPDHYIVVKNAGKRRAVRWNGFMWADVQEQRDAD
jgi:hypothetical protein